VVCIFYLSWSIITHSLSGGRQNWSGTREDTARADWVNMEKHSEVAIELFRGYTGSPQLRGFGDTLRRPLSPEPQCHDCATFEYALGGDFLSKFGDALEGLNSVNLVGRIKRVWRSIHNQDWVNFEEYLEVVDLEVADLQAMNWEVWLELPLYSILHWK